MNPKPMVIVLKRLETVLFDIPDTDPTKKEFQRAFKLLETEQKGRDNRLRCDRQGTTINWKHHMVDSGSGQSPDMKNLQRFENKVIFKRMHSMSARNSSLSRVRRGRKESSWQQIRSALWEDRMLAFIFMKIVIRMITAISSYSRQNISLSKDTCGSITY